MSAVLPTEPRRDADTHDYDVEVFTEQMPYVDIMKVGTCVDNFTSSEWAHYAFTAAKWHFHITT